MKKYKQKCLMTTSGQHVWEKKYRGMFTMGRQCVACNFYDNTYPRIKCECKVDFEEGLHWPTCKYSKSTV